MARNWANLPQELLQLCSRRLCPKNLLAFRAVCRSWQSAAAKERSDVPWLMLTDKKGMLWREFFCLPCQQVHTKLPPEAMANRYFSSRGWVLTISRDWELNMLKNPMSRYNNIIKLPNWNKFPNIHVLPPFYVDFISKFVLSDGPTTSLDYKVMVIYDSGLLGLWKPGEEEWMAVAFPTDDNYEVFDVIYYKECFVAVDCEGRIWRCDVDGPTPFEAQLVFEMPQKVEECEQEYPSGSLLYLVQVYLVQSTTGSLLFVLQRERERHTKAFQFQVFEIDLDTQTCTEVESLENTSLFLGCNSSFTLEVDENLIKPNCIYFTDDYLSLPQFTEDGGDTKMGIYHLEDGTVELCVKGKSSPPLWI
ncbi:F-box protein SKIP23-like [Syzygium oleosum]|uniref:F-box protein SKIP23-like n=1 Tax=Syzygium oleosum TaxID=219896 RepID=UPI0011D28B51|nr:F-box protein SKIP23-like [Syzygium oleosum]